MINELQPILADLNSKAGTARVHYFHRILLAASYIHKNAPIHQINVGSRIDGFVAHAAYFRKIDVLDAKPISQKSHENIKIYLKDSLQSFGRIFGNQ